MLESVFLCGGIGEQISKIHRSCSRHKSGIMKMKKVGLLAMLALLLFSCNEKPKTLKPVSSRIEGPLADCFEVVERDYPIIGNQVNIEFTRVNDCQIESQIVADFLDDAGNVIATSNVGLNDDQEVKFLFANKVGESSTVAFAVDKGIPTKVRIGSLIPSEEDGESHEVANDTEVVPDETILEDLDAPVVYDDEIDENDEDEEDEEDDGDEEEDEEDEDEETPSQSVRSSNSKDWDKLLDDYENYVDQYIKFLKKANSGDMTAMTEYVSFLEKAEKLEEELDKAKNDLSVAQSQRLVKISKKMTDAAMSF